MGGKLLINWGNETDMMTFQVHFRLEVEGVDEMGGVRGCRQLWLPLEWDCFFDCFSRDIFIAA